ncbi:MULTISPECIES: CinA family protein [Helicobacter]|uniref:C-terminal domain of CinA type S n=1 Tax=Helicobacter typhlonius TaxID=76936 RepID=A0A099UAB1_9HELI|nr:MULTISPECIES: CinA family protein [Helicobacter]TLD78360.1 CinA family protein [Helicobacter typhlonius]TLD87092.1 CinA family protein [Helicobacter sp. MIT 03-1616]CUU39164.1 C-terminal domain of CinA type S [Helicobacter typhlonius]HCD73619.1 CinA family protein [Helicobacter sp.]
MKPNNDFVILHSDLAQRVSEILAQRGMKVGIAESCTGGLLSYHFTMLSGASEILDGAMISYANAIKASWLNVSEENLTRFGAVSEPVVRAMCEGILKQSGADVALATSGIAGPTGGSESKPVGSVYIGVQHKGERAHIELCHFDGGRIEVQSQTCAKALEMLLALLDS